MHACRLIGTSAYACMQADRQLPQEWVLEMDLERISLVEDLGEGGPLVLLQGQARVSAAGAGATV